MPADDSLGFDDNESVGPTRPDTAKHNLEQPIGPPEPRPGSSLFHDCELLPEGGIFHGEVES